MVIPRGSNVHILPQYRDRTIEREREKREEEKLRCKSQISYSRLDQSGVGYARFVTQVLQWWELEFLA